MGMADVTGLVTSEVEVTAKPKPYQVLSQEPLRKQVVEIVGARRGT